MQDCRAGRLEQWNTEHAVNKSAVIWELSFEGFLQSRQSLPQDYSVHFASSSFLESVCFGFLWVFLGVSEMAAIHHFGKSRDLQIDA